MPTHPHPRDSRKSTTGSAVRRLASTFLGALLSLQALQTAAADLMLFPTRIVFDKNQRTAQVELVNNGSNTLTYRIALVNRRMNETGGFLEASPPLPDEQFADTMLRYSPRQVVLAPGVAQTVRIQLRKPAELAAGEYRSHLMFSQIAEAAQPPASGASTAAGDGAGLEIKLTALMGASIPVIVRHGQTAVTATLAHLRVEPGEANGPPMLAFEIHRQGNRSLYGDLVVTRTAVDGSEQPVARANGVAVYVPNAHRTLRIALPPSAAAAGGTLSVTFQERPEDGGGRLAQARLPLR